MKLVSLVLIPFIMAAQNKCSDLTTGKYKPEFGPFTNGYEIIRTDSTQIDVDKVMGVTSTFKIVWTDSCQYKLKRINGPGCKDINGYDVKNLTFNVQNISSLGFTYLVLYDNNILVDTTRLLKIEKKTFKYNFQNNTLSNFKIKNAYRFQRTSKRFKNMGISI